MEGEVGEGEGGGGVNDRLNRQTSKLIIMHGWLHPCSNIDRLYKLNIKGRLRDKGW